MKNKVPPVDVLHRSQNNAHAQHRDTHDQCGFRGVTDTSRRFDMMSSKRGVIPEGLSKRPEDAKDPRAKIAAIYINDYDRAPKRTDSLRDQRRLTTDRSMRHQSQSSRSDTLYIVWLYRSSSLNYH